MDLVVRLVSWQDMASSCADAAAVPTPMDMDDLGHNHVLSSGLCLFLDKIFQQDAYFCCPNLLFFFFFLLSQ